MSKERLDLAIYIGLAQLRHDAAPCAFLCDEPKLYDKFNRAPLPPMGDIYLHIRSHIHRKSEVKDGKSSGQPME